MRLLIKETKGYKPVNRKDCTLPVFLYHFASLRPFVISGVAKNLFSLSLLGGREI